MRRFLIAAALALALATGGARGGESPPEREPAAPQDAPRGPRRDESTRRIIARFIAVEGIARLPERQRQTEVPRLYREVALELMSPLVEGIISSFPADLFQQAGFLQPDEDGAQAVYALQIDAAAAAMTPQTMADAIHNCHGSIILALAARVRCLQTLERHKPLVKKLISEDLASDSALAVSRACGTIRAMRLEDFNHRLLAMYLADGRFAAEARSAILWLNDPDMTGALVADVEKNPAAIKRHYGLLNGMLWGKEAEPAIVRLLDADDADIRCWAAMAVQDCRDRALAPRIKALLEDKDARLRLTAAHMAGRLGAAEFQTVRANLLTLLAGDDIELRLEAAVAFAEQKDSVAGEVLLQMWQQPAAEDVKVKVMQTVGKLAGSAFGYNMHEWAERTPGNLDAIEKLRQWIWQHEAIKAPE